MADLVDTVTFVDPVASLSLGHGETLLITIEARRGRRRVAIREWFDSAGSMRPGREGIRLRPEMLDEVIAALQTARIKVTGRGAL